MSKRGEKASGYSIVPFGLKRMFARLRRCLLLTWREGERWSLWTSVQSPLLYGFFIDVVRNHSAYYAYGEFARLWRRFSRRKRCLAKLLFRLANYVRPAVILVAEQKGERWIPFLERGSQTSRVATYRDAGDLAGHWMRAVADSRLDGVDSNAVGAEGRPVLMVLEDCGDDAIIHALAGGAFAKGSIVAVADVCSTKRARRGWQQLCAMEWANVSIDLYFAGLIMINPAYSQLHYKSVL